MIRYYQFPNFCPLLCSSLFSHIYLETKKLRADSFLYSASKNYSRTNQFIKRATLESTYEVIKILITRIMGLYLRCSYKCLFLSDGKICLRDVKENVKKNRSDYRFQLHSFYNFCPSTKSCINLCPSPMISYVTSIVFSMTICQKQKHIKSLLMKLSNEFG